MECYMEWVSYNGQMGLFTKESSITIRYREMVNICLRMEVSIKGR